MKRLVYGVFSGVADGAEAVISHYGKSIKPTAPIWYASSHDPRGSTWTVERCATKPLLLPCRSDDSHKVASTMWLVRRHNLAEIPNFAVHVRSLDELAGRPGRDGRVNRLEARLSATRRDAANQRRMTKTGCERLRALALVADVLMLALVPEARKVRSGLDLVDEVDLHF